MCIRDRIWVCLTRPDQLTMTPKYNVLHVVKFTFKNVMHSRTKHCEMGEQFFGWVAYKLTNFSADKNKFLELSTRLYPRAGPTRVHLWRKMTSLNTKIYRKSRNKATGFRERSKRMMLTCRIPSLLSVLRSDWGSMLGGMSTWRLNSRLTDLSPPDTHHSDRTYIAGSSTGVGAIWTLGQLSNQWKVK